MLPFIDKFISLFSKTRNKSEISLYKHEIESFIFEGNKVDLVNALRMIKANNLEDQLFSQDKTGFCLLHNALFLSDNDPEIFLILLDNSSSKYHYLKNNHGQTPLGLAANLIPNFFNQYASRLSAFYNLKDVHSYFDFLMNKDVDEYSIFSSMLSHNQYQNLDYLIDNGILHSNVVDAEDNNLLIIALRQRNVRSVQYLLDKGCLFSQTGKYSLDTFMFYLLHLNDEFKNKKLKSFNKKDKDFLKEVVQKNLYSFDYSQSNLMYFIHSDNIKVLDFIIDELDFDLNQNADKIFQSLCSKNDNSLDIIKYFVNKGLDLKGLHSLTNTNFPNLYFILTKEVDTCKLIEVADYFFNTLQIDINATFRNTQVSLAHNLNHNKHVLFSIDFLNFLRESKLDFLKPDSNNDTLLDTGSDYIKQYIQTYIIEKQITEEKSILTAIVSENLISANKTNTRL